MRPCTQMASDERTISGSRFQIADSSRGTCWEGRTARGASASTFEALERIQGAGGAHYT